jgi:thiosulfate/3-mercaptopyruvate sulfurtransferase
MITSRFTAIVLAALMVLALAACGSDEPTEPTATPYSGPAPDLKLASITAKGYSNPDRLVTPEWIVSRSLDIQHGRVVLLDIRKEEDYNLGHIPGAIYFNTKGIFQDEVAGVPGMLPGPSIIEEALGSLGITGRDTVIFYDSNTNLSASRALWALDVYGHGDTRLIDGSWKAWAATGGAMTTEIPSVTATTYAFTTAPNGAIIANWEEVLASVDDPSTIVCDTRSTGEYTGQTVRNGVEHGGHIPASLHVEWNKAIDPDSGAFLPAAELATLYADSGIQGTSTVITLCQTAVRATHSWFVLQDLLGYPSVQVYDGSWVEWGNSDLPITIKG